MLSCPPSAFLYCLSLRAHLRLRSNSPSLSHCCTIVPSYLSLGLVLYVADTNNHRVRRLSGDVANGAGTVTCLAGRWFWFVTTSRLIAFAFSPRTAPRICFVCYDRVHASDSFEGSPQGAVDSVDCFRVHGVDFGMRCTFLWLNFVSRPIVEKGRRV